MAQSKKQKKAQPAAAPTVSALVDSLEKALGGQTASLGELNNRIKDVRTRAPKVVNREEVSTDSALASRLAKLLHQLQANTTNIQDITATTNL